MKKIVGITMGDPAGIGPEIAIKVLNKQALYDRCRPLLIGDESVLKYYLEKHPELALAINVVKKICQLGRSPKLAEMPPFNM